MSARCDLHELENCGLCNGAAKRFEASIKDDYPATDETRPPLPQLPGGVSIYSQFGGTCDGCGRRYLPNTPIFRPRDNSTGWVVIECCGNS